MFKNTFGGLTSFWKLPITFFLATSIISTGVKAQTLKVLDKNSIKEVADWTINLGVGYGTYFGDLSPFSIKNFEDWKQLKYFFDYNKNYIKKPSWHVSIEHTFNNGGGLLMTFNQTNIMMSDRYVGRDGIYRTGNKNFNRALNFKSEIYDAGLAYKIKSNKAALINPYLWLGAGASYFKTYGDLYDKDGQSYNYTLATTKTDGEFETTLRNLLTETDVKYNNIVPFANLGIGLSVRINSQFSLAFESDIKYSFSDYIDDVSGLYKSDYPNQESRYAAHPGTNIVSPLNPQRGNDDGVNDFYIQNRFVLKFSFFSSKKQERIKGSNFKAPVIFPNYYKATPSDSLKRNHTTKNSLPHNNPDSNSLSIDTTSLSTQYPNRDEVDTIYYKIIPKPINRNNFRFLPLDFYRLKIGNRKTLQYRNHLLLKDSMIMGSKPNNFINPTPRLDNFFTDTVYIKDTTFNINEIRKITKPDSTNTIIDTVYAYNAPRTMDTISNAQITAIQNKLQALYNSNDSLRNNMEAILYEKQLNQIKLKNDSLKLEQLKQQLALRDTALTVEKANVKDSKKVASTSNKQQRSKTDAYNDSLINIATQRAIERQAVNQKKLLETQAIEKANLEKQIADLKTSNAALDARIQNYPTTAPPITQRNDDVNSRALREIKDDIRSLNNQMDTRNISPIINPVIPIQGNNNRDLEREVVALRAELNKMRADAAKLTGDTTKRIDTVVLAQPAPDTNIAPSKIDSLQAALVAISNNLEDLKKQQLESKSKPAEKITQAPPVLHPQTVSLFFNTGATTVSQTQLDKLLVLLNQSEVGNISNIELNAYTDATGNKTVNERVSKQRAAFVENFLINQKRIPTNAISINYFPSSSAGGKSSNPADRRVDVIIKYK